MPTRNKEVFNRIRNSWVARRREFFNEIKNVPCADCGVRYPPYVMQFDHRPGEIKLFTIAKNWQYSKEKILAEIAKCDIVCANCHAERTHSRGAVSQLAEEVVLETT